MSGRHSCIAMCCATVVLNIALVCFPSPIAPIDYIGGVFTVPIRENETMGSQVIQTIQTDAVEHDEDFKAILTIPAGSDNVVIGINTTYVTIIDTTGESMLKQCIWPTYCIYIYIMLF